MYYVNSKICIFIQDLQKPTSIFTFFYNKYNSYWYQINNLQSYFSESISTAEFEVLFIVVRLDDAVNSCNFFAVDKAFIKACLDRPNEKDVLYFTDSNNASIKSEEHRNDNRAAKAIAVIKLAIFSGKRVGEALNKLVEYVVSCPVDTTMSNWQLNVY